MTFDQIYPDAKPGDRTTNGVPSCHKKEEAGKCIVCDANTNWASRRVVYVCGPEHHTRLWNDLIQMFAISNIVS